MFPTATHDPSRLYIALDSYPYPSTALQGPPQPYIALDSYRYFLIAIHGPRKLYMAPHSYTWPFTAIHSPWQLYMALHSYTWRVTQRICSSLYLFPRGILLAGKNTGVPMSWLGNLLLRGMPKAYHVLKPGWCRFFFVGSHKCAYPTDIRIKLRSGDFTFIPSSISELPCPI